MYCICTEFPDHFNHPNQLSPLLWPSYLPKILSCINCSYSILFDDYLIKMITYQQVEKKIQNELQFDGVFNY